MGDLLEISTSFKEERRYIISSDALKFYVKGKGSAVIKLFSNSDEEEEDQCVVKILISNKGSCIHPDAIIEREDMISEHTYKPYWISWYGGKVRVGEGDDPRSFLAEDVIETVNYISFSSYDNCIIHWKFRMPPKIKEPTYKKISGGQLKWVKMESSCLPKDALIGGYENEILYIMRAMHEEALTPGKFVPSKAAGYVAWGYEAHKKTEEMEVLCGCDGMWVKSQNDHVPKDAVAGGYSEVNHETLYVGRATYDGYIIPGKVQPSHEVCYMAYKELTVKKQCNCSSAFASRCTILKAKKILIRHPDLKIEILCGYDGFWIPTEGDKIPPGALVGGYTEHVHETMFVGRALHDDIVIPGKIAPSHKVCYIPCDGKEIAKRNYEILVNLFSANKK